MSGASLSHLLPPLPGFSAPQNYAPWPVWAGSTTKPVRFAAMAKKAAVRLWHRARDFDRGTHQPGHHGGAVGHTGLAVLHALIFDFLNHRTGRLDPSYAAIAGSVNPETCEPPGAQRCRRHWPPSPRRLLSRTSFLAASGSETVPPPGTSRHR
jgi:hypothetical protein